MKRKKAKGSAGTAGVQPKSDPQARPARPLGGVLLATATYQVLAVSLGAGTAQAAPADVLKGSLPLPGFIGQAGPLAPGLGGLLPGYDGPNGWIPFACIGCTTGPDNVPGRCVSGTGSSCDDCTSCTSCKRCTDGCTHCTSCTSGCTGCTNCTQGTSAGSPHPKYPHVVWDGSGHLVPAPGYTWAKPGSNHNFRVKPLPEGTPHPQYPNVVWAGDGEQFHPADGYCWASDPPSASGFRVVPWPEGTPHPSLPHVVWSGEGNTFHPANGWVWASDAPAKDHFRVKPMADGSPHEKYPHVIWSGDGVHFRPAKGYAWASDPPGQADFRVEPLPDGTPYPGLPHVVWGGDGQHYHPAPGYRWVDPNAAGDTSVEPVPDGTPHPTLAHVVWSGDGQHFHPAPGYRWVDPNAAGNTSIEPLPDGTPHPSHANVVWSGDGESFHPAPGYQWISDPPGKAGFGVIPVPQATPDPASEAAYRQAIAQDPDSRSAHAALAMALESRQRYADAEAEYRALLRIDAHDELAQVSLGNVLRRLNRPAEAAAAYRQALALDAGNAAARAGLQELTGTVPPGGGAPPMRGSPEPAGPGGADEELRDAVADHGHPAGPEGKQAGKDLRAAGMHGTLALDWVAGLVGDESSNPALKTALERARAEADRRWSTGGGDAGGLDAVVLSNEEDPAHPQTVSVPEDVRTNSNFKRLANENDAISHQIETAERKLAEIKADPGYAQSSTLLTAAYNQQNAIASLQTVRAYVSKQMTRMIHHEEVSFDEVTPPPPKRTSEPPPPVLNVIP